MCEAILRVTYIGKDIIDVKVGKEENLEEKIIGLRDNAQVERVEVFLRSFDWQRETIWRNALEKKDA